MAKQIQIDVLGPVTGSLMLMNCNLYADGRCVKIFMHVADYESLVRDGFFIRNGKSKDSANVLNTTDVYKLETKKVNGH